MGCLVLFFAITHIRVIDERWVNTEHTLCSYWFNSGETIITENIVYVLYDKRNKTLNKNKTLRYDHVFNDIKFFTKFKLFIDDTVHSVGKVKLLERLILRAI